MHLFFHDLPPLNFSTNIYKLKLMKCGICINEKFQEISYNNVNAFKCCHCGYIFKQNVTTDYQSLSEKEFSLFSTNRIKEATELSKIINKIFRDEKGVKLIEIGCGTGSLLHALQTIGFSVYGFEPSLAAFNISKKYYKFQKNVINSYFKNNNFCSDGDVFLLYDVIEHLKGDALLRLLIEIRNVMKTNSVLVIKSGDAQSLFAWFEIRKWHYFSLEQHISFYNKQNLKLLCEKLDMEIINFFRFRHAYGGIALKGLIKNFIKLIVHMIFPIYKKKLKILNFELSNDHFIAVIKKKNIRIKENLKSSVCGSPC